MNYKLRRELDKCFLTLNYHPITPGYIEKSAECMEGINIEDMDCDTCPELQEILRGRPC